MFDAAIEFVSRAKRVRKSGVLADLWPTLKLRLETPRLTLRIPNDDELARLAELAAEGVHRDGERPFLTPWTEGTPRNGQNTSSATTGGAWPSGASLTGT